MSRRELSYFSILLIISRKAFFNEFFEPFCVHRRGNTTYRISIAHFLKRVFQLLLSAGKLADIILIISESVNDAYKINFCVVCAIHSTIVRLRVNEIFTSKNG
jgi:hypothetical protein